MPEIPTIGVQLPGEAAIVAIFTFATALVEGQPPDIKRQLWEQHAAIVNAVLKFLGILK